MSFLGTLADSLWCIEECHDSLADECLNMPWSQYDKTSGTTTVQAVEWTEVDKNKIFQVLSMLSPDHCKSPSKCMERSDKRTVLRTLIFTM